MADAPTTRIIDGTLYKRADTPYAFDLRVHTLGHGHTEATVQPCFAWHEIDHLTPGAAADHLACLADTTPLTKAELLDRAAMNRKRSARRARTKVRRLAKFKGLDTLLTLTYRENMIDRERMQRDLDVFLKRLRRVLPSFEYICVFERQKRGAWHAHLACHRVQAVYMHKGALVKSYALIRALWRAVVGQDNGNIDFSRNARIKRSSSRLSIYIAKYIGKEFGEEFDRPSKHANTYSASGRDIPEATLVRVATLDQATAIAHLVDLLHPELQGDIELHQAYIDGGGYFLCVSPSS